VLNCDQHPPYYGIKGEPTSIDLKGLTISPWRGKTSQRPLHLYKDDDRPILKYWTSHRKNAGPMLPYPLTFLNVIESKERIRNVQEHYFWEEQVFGFYSELISQAYGPLSLLYFSEIELPKLYFNAYLVIELIHHPSGSRQQVVKKIGAGTQALN
jgi:hypothetical protein